MSKLTVNTKLLARELAYVQAIVNENPTNPIWSNVLLQTEGNKMSIVGTNSETAAKTTFILSQAPDEPMQFAMPARRLLDIVRLIETETINISESKERLTITAGAGRYNFSKISDAALHIKPIVPEDKITGLTVEVGSHQFANVVNTAGKFVAKDDTTKFTLMAIRFDIDDKQIAGRAMDGHRAVDVTQFDPADGREQTTIIVSNDAIPLLTSIVDTAEKVQIIKADSVLAFRSGERLAVTRRAAAENLPNVGQHIDQFVNSNKVKVTIDAPTFTKSVKRLQVAVDGKLRRIALKAENNLLKLHSVALLDQAIEFDEEIVADIQGSSSCDLNAAFMLDFLKHVDGSITIHMGGDNIPVVFTDQTGIRCMFMQMKY